MTPEETHDAHEALEGLLSRTRAYAQLRRYAAGQHPTMLTRPKLELAFGSLLADYRNNVCGAVIDSAADRLRVTGWAADDAVVERIADLERRTRFERTQREVFGEALTCGDAYLLVWPDATGAPRIYGQPAHTCAVTYDGEDPTVVTAAVKVWRERKRVRLNVYLPDRIERLVTAKETDTVPEDLGAFVPVADQPVVANPLGFVPVFHLAPAAALGTTGRSDIADVLPLQDALNKSDVDILVLGEFYGGPLRALIGVDEMRDERGRRVAPRVAPGDVLELPQGADIKELQPADITKLLETSDHWAAKIARVSRTPLHLLGLAGDTYPSGEALKTAERPLVDRVRDHQAAFEDAVAGAMRAALILDGVAAPGDPRPVWAPAETVTEEQRLANAAAKLRVGYSTSRVLADLGESASTIDQMAGENEVAADLAANRAAGAYNAGLG